MHYLFIKLTCTFSLLNNVLTYFALFSSLICVVHDWAHLVGGTPPKIFLIIGIGFNGAETSCGIAHILGILPMNSYDT